MMGSGVLLWLLFGAAIGAGLVLLLQAMLGSDGHPAKEHKRRALDILNERFARGEIEHHELEERRKVLRS